MAMQQCCTHSKHTMMSVSHSGCHIISCHNLSSSLVTLLSCHILYCQMSHYNIRCHITHHQPAPHHGPQQTANTHYKSRIRKLPSTHTLLWPLGGALQQSQHLIVDTAVQHYIQYSIVSTHTYTIHIQMTSDLPMIYEEQYVLYGECCGVEEEDAVHSTSHCTHCHIR